MLPEKTAACGDQVQIKALQEEIEALTDAARERERLVIEGYKQMDRMLQAVEEQRNALQNANSDLARARAYLDRLIETMDEVLIVIGMHGTIELVNARLAELAGYSRDELVGADPSILFVPEELCELAGESANAVAPPRGLALLRLLFRLRGDQLDGHLVTRGGLQLAHLFRWSSLYSNYGKREGVVVVGADVRKLHFTLDALERAHREMRLVLDHVDQGLLTIHLDGTLGDGRSAQIERWFGAPRRGARLWEYLGQHDVLFGEDFQAAWETVVEEARSVELNIEHLPRRLRTRSAIYEVACRPIYDGGKLWGAFAVITDVTVAVQHAAEMRMKAEFTAVLDQVNRDRQAVVDFRREVGQAVNEVIAGSRSRGGLLGTVRLLRATKDRAAQCGIVSLEEVCMRIETHLIETGRPLSSAQCNELAQAWESSSAQIDKVLGASALGLTIDGDDYARLLQLLEADAPKETILQTAQRLTIEPTERRLSRLGDQVAALAQRSGKGPLSVRVEAGDERFPMAVWASFWAAFPQVVRNAVEHGLESAEEREAAGKAPMSTIVLRVLRADTVIVVEVADDGRGIDWNKLRGWAQALGIAAESDEELERLLLSDGFSTGDAAGVLSGRGAGMAALVQACHDLGGVVLLHTVRGRGTTVRCELPYRLVV